MIYKINFFANFDINNKIIYYECEQIKDVEIIFMFFKDKPVTKLINTTGYIILKKTPFYAEKCGQASDRGIILKDVNNMAYVLNIKQGTNKQYIHYVKVKVILKIGDFINITIDSERIFYIRKNHSCTYLINAALRKILGNQITQIGSYNDDNCLYIDISYNKTINLEEIIVIENLILKTIKEDIPCEIIYIDIQTALNFYNSLYFFKEKFDDIVRIVKFGTFSCELCSGIYVSNSQDIEDLLITNFESKGVGVFRIYAITSNKKISNYLNNQFLKEKTKLVSYFDKYNCEKNILNEKKIEHIWHQINSLTITKINLKNLKKLILQFNKYFKCWQKKYNNILIQLFINQNSNLLPEEKNGINILTYKFTTKINTNNLKKLVNNYKINYKKILIFISDISDKNKIISLVGVSNDLFEYYQADKIIKQINLLFNGKCGGNISVAQNCFNNKNNNVFAKLLSNPLKFLKYYD